MRLVLYRRKWHAYERDAARGPRRTSLGTADRAIAERRLRDLESARRKKATTVSEIIAGYVADRGPLIASQETLRFALRRIEPVFGHLRPEQVTRALTRAYAARRRRQQVGDGTIRRELVTLSAALRWADRNTPAIIEMPPAPPPKSRHLTRDQYRALREAARLVPHCHVFVWLAYRTGGRSAAILDLTWDRVDFARGQIRLGNGMQRVKGRATVPMREDLAEVLREAQRSALTDRVIEYGGKPVGSIKRAFRAAVARAGLPAGTSPHVLRHSAAVHMAEAAVPMSEIAQYLGHSSESVTYRVYARYSPDYLRRAAGALE